MEQSYPIPLQSACLLENLLRKIRHHVLTRSFCLTGRSTTQAEQRLTRVKMLQKCKTEARWRYRCSTVKKKKKHKDSMPPLKSTRFTAITTLLCTIDNYGSNQTRTNELSNNSCRLTRLEVDIVGDLTHRDWHNGIWSSWTY